MAFERYCQHCGSEVKIEYGVTEYTCPDCQMKSNLKDLVPGFTLEIRTEQLRAMHTLMQNCNDENIYERWICLFPDGASEDDMWDIALDKENYNECFDLFLKLVAKNGMRW